MATIHQLQYLERELRRLERRIASAVSAQTAKQQDLAHYTMTQPLWDRALAAVQDNLPADEVVKTLVLSSLTAQRTQAEERRAELSADLADLEAQLTVDRTMMHTLTEQWEEQARLLA